MRIGQIYVAVELVFHSYRCGGKTAHSISLLFLFFFGWWFSTESLGFAVYILWAAVQCRDGRRNEWILPSFFYIFFAIYFIYLSFSAARLYNGTWLGSSLFIFLIWIFSFWQFDTCSLSDYYYLFCNSQYFHLQNVCQQSVGGDGGVHGENFENK